MSTIRHSFNGFYHPAFFRMNIPTPESLMDLSQLPAAVESFYLHEYIHFLQDVSTTDGLANAAMMGNYVRYAVQAVQDPDTVLPLRVPETAIIAPQQALRRLYLGDNISDRNKPQPVLRQVTSVKPVNSGTVLPDGREPIRIEVTFASGEAFDFGSTWLSESMAFIAESMVYPAATPPPQVAYYSAELIADYLYPALGRQNRENILALCDASLLFLHPGRVFCMLLERMKEQQWMPLLPEEIYAYANQTLLFTYKGITTTGGLLDYSAGQAIEFVAGYFTAKEFRANSEWVQHVIGRAVHLRQEEPYFILTLVRNGPIKTNPYFAHLLRWLGSPLTTNNDDEGSIVMMRDFPEGAAVHHGLFRAIRQMLSLFNSGQRGCDMRPYCQKSCDDLGVDDFTDGNCSNTPWRRYTSANGLCSYGVMWQMWGLNGTEPQFATSSS